MIVRVAFMRAVRVGVRMLVDVHGAGIFTAYFHLSEIGVEVGQRVKQSDVIGKVGETGRTTGPHLHYAVRAGKRWVDPESFMALSIGAPVSEPRI